MMYRSRIDHLERESIKLIQSIHQIASNPAVLWSTGKDSTTMLYLIRRTFNGVIPWPVVHIDTGRKFQEIYDFRERMRQEWNIPLLVAKNESAMQLGIGPEKVSHYDCCTLLKTEALKALVKGRRFDALVMSIRHDEHYARGMEDLLSLRDAEGNWQWWGRFGGFGLTAPESEGYAHIRIHPLLPWREEDVWEFVISRGLPINPLYFPKQAGDGKWYRYRSLGCEPCTTAVESKAQTPRDILDEVYSSPGLERSGREQDKEADDVMLRLRALGYM